MTHVSVVPSGLTLVAATPPNLTVVPATRFVPEIVTDLAAFTGPAAGETEEIVGGPTYVKPFVSVPTWESGFVTVTFTMPFPAGTVAVIVVAFTMVTAVALFAPNLTVAPAAKPVPEIVTGQFPARGPGFGVTDVMTGPETITRDPLARADCPSGFVTRTLYVPPLSGTGAVSWLELIHVALIGAFPPKVTRGTCVPSGLFWKYVPLIVMG